MKIMKHLSAIAAARSHEEIDAVVRSGKGAMQVAFREEMIALKALEKANTARHKRTMDVLRGFERGEFPVTELAARMKAAKEE